VAISSQTSLLSLRVSKSSLRSGTNKNTLSLALSSLQIVALSPHARGKYDRLSLGIEGVTEVKMFYSFLTEGKLPPLASLAPCDDEEFIGATLNLSQQLVRFCSNCALEVPLSLS
jgi:hypothetical protein